MTIPKYNYEEVIKFWNNQKLQTEEDYKNILENFSVLFALEKFFIMVKL